jgi:hypothetical protein
MLRVRGASLRRRVGAIGVAGALVGMDEAVLDGGDDGLGAVGHAECFEDVADVDAGSLFGDAEMGGARLVAAAGGEGFLPAVRLCASRLNNSVCWARGADGGETCCQIDPSLESLLRRAAPLTEYAGKFRYPGDPEEATAEAAALRRTRDGDAISVDIVVG